MSNKTKKPDFSKAKEGDECWMYGIGETGIDSIGDDYVTVWDDENKYVFDKSGYLYLEEYIGGAYIRVCPADWKSPQCYLILLLNFRHTGLSRHGRWIWQIKAML